jgi:uncharacterized protein (TIGR00369 family)
MIPSSKTKLRIDTYREVIAKDGFHSPIGRLLGIALTEIHEGEAKFEMTVRPHHYNSVGTVQGGVLATMADAAMGIAFGSLLDETEKFATMEFQINFISPVIEGKIQALGKIVHAGKRTGLIECEIRTADGKLIAKAFGTQIRL